jgi:hypothetical protein
VGLERKEPNDGDRPEDGGRLRGGERDGGAIAEWAVGDNRSGSQTRGPYQSILLGDESHTNEVVFDNISESQAGAGAQPKFLFSTHASLSPATHAHVRTPTKSEWGGGGRWAGQPVVRSPRARAMEEAAVTVAAVAVRVLVF